MSNASADRKTACITLDLENDWYFEEPGYDHLTFEYIDEFIELVSGLDVPLSIFAVGRTIERYPEAIDRLDAELDCEFHLHSYSHDVTKSYDFEREVRKGIAAYENHFGHRPVGYRAPQGNITDRELGLLEELGFEFDSSVFPSYRPGVYNNLSAPLAPYIPAGASSLMEIPPGAFPGIRIPTSHSYFKLVGRPLSSYLSVSPLPDVLVYNIHLQDLYKTDSHDRLSIPKRWIMKRNLENSERILRENVSTLLSRGYQSSTMTDVFNRYS